jgi:c-di-GMP-binding flagellar brake protein YcgR
MFETFPTERRTNARVRHQIEVFFKPGRMGNVRGFTRDLSETGSFIVAREKLTEGQDLLLYVPVEIQGRENLCMLRGKIVRIEKKNGVEAYGYGIHFNDVSSATSSALKRFVHQELKKGHGIPVKTTAHPAAA